MANETQFLATVSKVVTRLQGLVTVTERAGAALGAVGATAQKTASATTSIEGLTQKVNKAQSAVQSYTTVQAQANKAAANVSPGKATADGASGTNTVAESTQFTTLMDRLYPDGKRSREYQRDQKLLTDAIGADSDQTNTYREALQRLSDEYERNQFAASTWGQVTSASVGFIEKAFADKWKSILTKSDDFMANLKQSFKGFLAEMLHMAITKPIMVRIGAALGGGGLAGQVSEILGGGSSGGFNLESVWNTVSSAYNVTTSGLGQAWSAGWTSGDGFIGGLTGAIKSSGAYVTSAVSSLFSSTSGSVVNGVYQIGSSAPVATVDLISNTVTQGGTVVGTASGATTAATSALSASSAVMYGIGGAIQGYLKAGVKGAVAGAGGAVAGAYAGAAIGSAVPIIGNVIGAAIGAVLGGMFGASLFGGDWVTKDEGFQLGVTNGELESHSFEYQKKKGGLFSSNKKRTQLSAMDPELQAALDNTYAATLGTAIGLFDALNVTLNDGVLDGLSVAATQISTRDKTAEQIQEEISKWFTTLGDAAVGTIANATGEASLVGYTLSKLTTSLNALMQLNEILEKTNNGMLDVSVGGLHLAERLAELGGGMERFAGVTAGYYEKFVPEAERADDVLIDVGRQFRSLSIAFPETRDGFRQLVEAMDVTTTAGQDGYVALMNLAAGADAAYTILENRTQAATQAAADAALTLQELLMGNANAAFSALQRSINAQKTSINDMITTARSNAAGLTSVSNALSSALKALRGDSDSAVRMLRNQAKATVVAALAIARAGGSLSNFEGLENALSVISDNDTSLYSSLEDFSREQGRNANLISELNRLNGKQISSSEKTIAALEAQLTGLDKQLEFAQQQMDALNGVDNSVKSVADAIKDMNAAVVAAIASITGKISPQSAGVLIDSIYKDKLGRPADDGGKAYWQDQLASGNLNAGNITGAITNAAAIEAAYKAAGIAMNDGASYWATQLTTGALTAAQLQEAVRNAALANGQLPKYATGGLISGPGTGTSDSILARLSNGEYVMSADAVRMFGTGLLDQMNTGRLATFASDEAGPMLQLARPAPIYTNSSQIQGSGNAELLAEFRQLRQENRQAQFQIAKNTQKLEVLMRKWDEEGTPQERDYV
ncbi:hypothetical protein NJC38_00890 [Pseudomonas sp. 21LCFQ010]|uniref:hypothetical protein n=1 Tax=Pseudomonas sp. 21LCFQ010 TaxID=2957506 RepID=UPI002096E4C4|nr:hypothetical protein [Pseudomonas sp. 21LCFQ010]MCO8160719.1 hypothetical protein [Pseudomonas sp. 21LCFQ010]